ncbi:uncharacterized protein PV06_00511 [Exophiala oligosperma]|uniref:Zn(2)-C6 fungal-type domain-containing protein n=1 Tax=Exophiala oligosperma TaxID=215243 RepID=A0A0D2EIT2_9EURO|nr:uncharacterized protein PV06_00511 [Exophiala oligosperma]KIW47854.1 hypothetical protein PV06_00511 [Exophiala oligosperma]
MVYHGPSGGCKACRTRRVKCDQNKPSCNNCTRRHQTCPGYADVFDGAHRSQNKVIIQRVEKQNALRDSMPCIDNQSSNSSSGNSPAESSLSSSSSSSSLIPRSKSLKKPLQWVIYSAPAPTSDPQHDSPPLTEESEEDNTALQTHPVHTDTMPPIGFTFTLKPDSEEASTCFFFHHYTGTIYDENIHNGFAMMWQPLFLQAALDSPLRFVTTAFTVNITMMWCLKGCDTRPARRLMTKALTATRKAIQNPTPNKMDELLMTILIFDLYDSMVQHYIPVPVTSGKHKEGALALAQIRGRGNYDTPISAGLAKATRGTLLLHALRTRSRLMPGAENLFEDPSLPPTRASELELIVMQVVNLQARLWGIRRQGERQRQRNHDVYEAIILEAIKLDDLLVEWRQSITDPSWLAQYVHRDDAPPSVRAAGFYGERCTVWPDLIFAEMSNFYNQSRLVNLQVIRQALADVPSLLATTENQRVLLTINATVQRLVDAVCDCVPFHLGSTTVVTNPLYSDEVEFPIKTTKHPTTGKVTTVPHHIPLYKSRAAASGGWTLFPYVCGVFRMAEPEDDAVPIDLREGQLEWIRGQVKRMQNTFLYCDPVWFKRIPKASG